VAGGGFWVFDGGGDGDYEMIGARVLGGVDVVGWVSEELVRDWIGLELLR
jgi:hypothetical protein